MADNFKFDLDELVEKAEVVTDLNKVVNGIIKER
jgi:hypothetical protein